MPHLGHKKATSASTPSLRTLPKGLASQLSSETSAVDYSALKRAQLQHQCKKLGLRATGKNAELVQRLKTYHEKPQQKTAGGGGSKGEANKNEECWRNPKVPLTVSDLCVTKDVKTEPSEEKTELVQGWCVVHGMVLYRPPSSWAPLLLQGGLVCIQDGKDMVPFHLPPLNISVPKGLSDNYVCLDCVLRNREAPKRCPLCQQIQGKGNRAGLAQNFLKNLSPLQNGPSPPALLAAGASKDRRRTTEIRKLYQPQEDQAYAQRVDGILSQMARGELGMDRALCPLQPLVFHSPSPFDR